MESYFLTFLVFQAGLLIGFLLGKTSRLSSADGLSSLPEAKNRQADASREDKQRRVSIDSTRFVTNVQTDSFKKIGTDLGVTSEKTDDISSAANKLAQLKRNKQ